MTLKQWQRKFALEKARRPAELSKRIKYALKTEQRVMSWLNRYYTDVTKMSHRSPFDVLIGGKRVEIKSAVYNPISGWRFTIARPSGPSPLSHESKIDAYILRLEGFPGFKQAVHLILPSPIGQRTVSVTHLSMVKTYARYYNNFDAIGVPMRKRPSLLRAA